MLRIIVQETNVNNAAHVTGAKADISYRTFDIEAPDVEKYLRAAVAYETKTIIGVEMI